MTQNEILKQAVSQQDRMANLFLIGAGKCGTTSLHAYLSAHPDISGSKEKEPSFFIKQEELRAQQLMESMRPEASDLQAYLALFDGKPDARYRMEASPSYSSYPIFSDVPARIAAASPQAHIIYLVRNPVDRAISHYWQDRKILKETRPAEEALAEEDNIYSYTSDYKKQLDRFQPYFDNIQIYASETLRREPQVVLDRICDRLGLSRHALCADSMRERNTTPPTTREARHPLLKTLRDTPAWNMLRARMPAPLLHAVRKAAVQDVPRVIENEGALRQMLTARFSPMTRAFDRAYGTDFHTLWFSSTQ